MSDRATSSYEPGKSVGRQSLGRQFGWFWSAYAVSTFGSWLAFDAFAVIAILVLHSGTTAVAVLASAGLAAGAVVALPLGPWMEFRRKRTVMVAMDLIRFAAVLTLPLGYLAGLLSFGQLLAVSVLVGAADITFGAASGACLKALVRPADLLAANARLESTNWAAIVLGPPLGGAAIGLLGPVTTVLANAVSFLLSACGIRAIGGAETPPEPAPAEHDGGLLAGWRHLLGHPTLRPLFYNTVLVNGLIMATSPLLAVLMLGRLGFAPWQYGLAFALPSLGGLLGSRLAGRLVARFGQHRVLLAAGTARACWSVPLAFVRPGMAGLALVMVVEFGLICCAGVFNPVFASYRLEQTATDRLARTLSAWSVTSKASTAALIALWGVLAAVTGPRLAIGLVGLLLLASPLLLRQLDQTAQQSRELVVALD
jgi:MFS family permease